MCGIAGFTHRNCVPDAGIARRIAAVLVHRGPDQQGVYRSGDVSLCAVRLKIIDLGGGDQPMVSEDGTTAVAFNGEIYNHTALRRELQDLGYRFRSHCDTEVVLNAFRTWGTECFTRLRGMFAVALSAEGGKRLVLARDRLGIKPLYYHRRGGNLYFGSELKAIFEHPDVPRRLNLEALSHYLSLNWVPCPHTLAEGIQKLPPGHLLEWHSGEARVRPWWRLEFRPDQSLNLGAAKEELDCLLRESVREHLVSDVPLGIWASGGVDSSTILHYAAEASPVPLKTFSVSFTGRSFDETPYFREAARLYGTDHHEFDLNPDQELESAIAEFAWYSDEPSADAGALPVWFLSRMSRRHVTVALSGEGADELFGGYITYTADRLARPLRAVPAPLRRLLLAGLERWLPVSDDKISLEYKLKRGLAGSLLPPEEAHFFWNGAFTPEQVRRVCPNLRGPGADALIERLCLPEGRIGFVNRYMLVDQHYYLPDDILYKVDRMSMAHSLEVRPPFLDHRIVEFAARLPQKLKIHGSKQKYVLKELMRDKLPASILDRKKTGFDIPTHDWFRGPLRALLMETVSPAAVEATGIFNSGAVHSLISDHMERRINAGYQLWGLLTLFLWMKRWEIEVPPPEEAGSSALDQVLTTN
ncbi:MAG TPA: asparagine synthase (glutamine-hydrolyzing) [Bryobacteraceae bacterium]|nr:asparagine synthase (glutamine-hydrolyzing) [Bryobacteraceae bacterium]